MIDEDTFMRYLEAIERQIDNLLLEIKKDA
jgi:hypothetical protein